MTALAPPVVESESCRVDRKSKQCLTRRLLGVDGSGRRLPKMHPQTNRPTVQFLGDLITVAGHTPASSKVHKAQAVLMGRAVSPSFNARFPPHDPHGTVGPGSVE